MTADIVRVHLRIRGRVQGVFFRGSMCDAAHRLGIHGWVKNRDDGSVEAVAEGPRAQIDRLIAWAHGGPPGALVTDIDLDWETPRGDLGGFETRR